MDQGIKPMSAFRFNTHWSDPTKSLHSNEQHQLRPVLFRFLASFFKNMYLVGVCAYKQHGPSAAWVWTSELRPKASCLLYCKNVILGSSLCSGHNICSNLFSLSLSPWIADIPGPWTRSPGRWVNIKEDCGNKSFSRLQSLPPACEPASDYTLVLWNSTSSRKL